LSLVRRLGSLAYEARVRPSVPLSRADLAVRSAPAWAAGGAAQELPAHEAAAAPQHRAT